MARGRMLSKSLSTSKKYAQLYSEPEQPLGLVCQALYPLLVAHADDFGRLEGDVFTVRNSVVPASNWPETVIQAALTRLHTVQLVTWYEVSDNLYLQIVDWERHQSGLHKRTSSRFPRVPGNSRKVRGLPTQLNRTELKGTEQKGTSTAAPEAPPLATITKLTHDVIGVLGTSSLSDLTEAVKSRCAEFKIPYDGVTVRKAIDSALAQRKRSA